MLEIHQDAVPVPEEMQFKVQEQCSTSLLQTTKPMRSGAFSISSTIPPIWRNSHHQQGRLHKSPTSSGHKKINLVLKYSANEVSFSDPAIIVTGIRFIE
jgi:hypothetical protein